LKVDVQKSELEVLRGIDESDWQKIEQVVLEVHDVDGRLRQIVSLLEAQGFRVAVEQEVMLKETGLFDVYCVRPEREGQRAQQSDGREATARLAGWTSQDALLEDVRAYLKANLPEHMIPSAFVLLDEMPLTPNGKVDRRALPEPAEAGSDAGKTYVAPRTETEETLAGIWRQVLGVERVGVHDNFFELGGDSILSIQIVARANQAGLKLSPKQVFRHQCIAELAAAVAETADSPHVEAEQGLLTGTLPLTPVQHYFFEQSLTEQHHFNQSLLLTLRRSIDAELLQRVVTAVVEHHDALRLRFELTAAGWQQSYGGTEAVSDILVQHIDVSSLSGEEQRGAIEATCDGVQRSMRLETGGLFRVVLFETGAEQRLLLAAHHLIVDGVSWRILVEDIERGIAQAERAEPVTLGRKTTSYGKWAERLTEYAAGEEANAELLYWSEVEKGAPARLPVDYPGGENSIGLSASVVQWLDAEATRALLQEVPKAYRTQINDVLLAALAEAVGDWSGRRQLLVDMEGHGRADELFADVDLSRTVGWFTSVYPVLLDLEGIEDAGAALKHVKEHLRSIPNGGIGYGVARYLKADGEGALRRIDAEMSFNYLGQMDQSFEADSLFAGARESQGALQSEHGRRRYLLEVTMFVAGGRLQVQWSYGVELHDRETIERLAADYLGALRRLIEHCRAGETQGFTASDFSLAGFDEDELEGILNEVEFEGI
ncbi:MAG TPA: condensation domain-containing protein, partial [Pyrinomonadaceae bacterium]